MIKFDRTVTLGQVLIGVIFVLSTIVGVAATLSDVAEIKENQELFVRKDVFNTQMGAIEREFQDLKLIMVLNGEGYKPSTSDLQGEVSAPLRRVLESGNNNRLYPDSTNGRRTK